MFKYLIILLLSTSAYGFEIDDKLIPALIQVESNGDNNTVGDNGNAYGCLQIWYVVIQDVNRVYKTKYKHIDMFYRNNSCEVCYMYLTYWSKAYKKRTGWKATSEVLARIWNGGPMGYKKNATIKYWERVSKELK